MIAGLGDVFMSEAQISWGPWAPAPSSHTLRAFLADRHKVCGLMGPVGAGKTVTSLTKLFFVGIEQKPDNDNVRRTRHLALRDTYGNLEDTTLASFRECYPQPGEPGVVGVTMNGGKNRRSTYKMLAALPDGTLIDFEIIFAAVGEISAEFFMKGFEITVLYLSEGDGLHPDVLAFGMGRIGRYPSMKNGPGATYFGVIMDFNAPTFDNYLRAKFYDGDPEIFKLFEQPSALSLEAENVENLKPDFYSTLMAVNGDKWILRNVHNKWGFSDHGKPVYPEFNSKIHVAEVDFEPIKGLTIYVGCDAGRTPSAILSQLDAEGQVRIFDEVLRVDMGAEAFARSLKDYLVQKYGWDFDFVGVGDPNAAYKTETAEATWLELVSNILGFDVVAAETNKPALRTEAVRSKLLRNISGNKPSLLISPRCKKLIAGFEHGYQYKKLVGSNDNYAPLPQKDEYSHPHDALQYLILHVTSDGELVGKSLAGTRPPREAPKQRNVLATRRRKRRARR